METEAPITFSCPLGEGKTPSKAKTHYIPEEKVAEPGSVPGCNGDGIEPVAEPGNLCVYQGFAGKPGSLKKEWKNAEFFQLTRLNGTITEAGKIGEMVIFRTVPFKEEIEPEPEKVAVASTLNAGGAWAVRSE